MVVLSAEEEITLRRIAFGQSELRMLRPTDVARLRTLRLIEDGKDGPQLTAGGRKRFDALPKPTTQARSGDLDLMGEMNKLLKEARR